MCLILMWGLWRKNKEKPGCQIFAEAWLTILNQSPDEKTQYLGCCQLQKKVCNQLVIQRWKYQHNDNILLSIRSVLSSQVFSDTFSKIVHHSRKSVTKDIKVYFELVLFAFFNTWNFQSSSHHYLHHKYSAYILEKVVCKEIQNFEGLKSSDVS